MARQKAARHIQIDYCAQTGVGPIFGDAHPAGDILHRYEPNAPRSH